MESETNILDKCFYKTILFAEVCYFLIFSIMGLISSLEAPNDFWVSDVRFLL